MPDFRPIQKYIPDRTVVSAKDINDIVRRLERLETFKVSPPLQLIDSNHGKYLSIQHNKIIRFKLIENQIPGQNATAVEVFYNKTTSLWNSFGTHEFEVYDPFIRYRGFTDYQGRAILYDTPAGFEIFEMEQKAKLVLFQLADPLSHSNQSQENCHVLRYMDGKDPGTKITVWNPEANNVGPFGFATTNQYVGASSASNAGDIGWAYYDYLENKYWIIDLEC